MSPSGTARISWSLRSSSGTAAVPRFCWPRSAWISRGVLAHEEVAGGGAAAGPARLLPLFEGAIMAEQASLEPGTRQRFVCPVAVLPSAQHLLATVRWRRPDQRTPSEFSRLVRLA